MKTKPGW